MEKSKYKHFKDGQEVEVQPGIGLNFACCDCALVHDLQVRLEGGKVFVSFTRDNRRTAALRRRYTTPMSHLTQRALDGACMRPKPKPNARVFMGVKLCLACGQPRK